MRFLQLRCLPTGGQLFIDIDLRELRYLARRQLQGTEMCLLAISSRRTEHKLSLSTRNRFLLAGYSVPEADPFITFIYRPPPAKRDWWSGNGSSCSCWSEKPFNVHGNGTLGYLGRVRLGSIQNKNNWNNASKRLFGSYCHFGIPGFPFRNIFLFRNIPNKRAPRYRPHLKMEVSPWKRFKCFPSTPRRGKLKKKQSLAFCVSQTHNIKLKQEISTGGLDTRS